MELRSWQVLARVQRWALQGWSRMNAARRVVNLMIPGVLMSVLLFAALPGSVLSEALAERQGKLNGAMRQISLVQRWLMYAPQPARGHGFQEYLAYDADGSVRVLPESDLTELGPSGNWAWNRDRHDIWMYVLTRKPDEVNRNRIWFIRGLCVREARLGHEVQHIEVNRIYRPMRSPEELLKTGETLGPPRKRKVVDTTCNVKIIRDMIAEDPLGAGAGEGAGG